MEYTVLQKEDENKKKGIIVSFMVHALLLLIALIPYWVSEEIPKELSGIVVAFGNPDDGSSNANPLSNSDDTPKAETAPQEKTSTDTKNKSTSSSKNKETKDPTPAKKPINKVKPISNVSDVAVDDTAKEKAKQEAAAEEAANKRRQAEEIAKQEAQKKAEEDAKKAAYNESKSKFSDLLGTGKGTNNNSGNEGNPDGDPNSDALNKIATGSGRIGGGLTDRGVLFEPKIDDNSQYTGVVVVKVCVDKTGKVVEANFTQLGSTTTNKTLVDLAVSAAKKYQFTPSEIETQCGNITIEFKVR